MKYWYHGSPHRFDAFRTETKRTFGTGASEVPVFLTPSLDFAESYAGGLGYVYKVRVDCDKLFDPSLLVETTRYWPPRYEDMTRDGKQLYEALEAGSIFPWSGTADEEYATFHDSQGLLASILLADYDVIETTEMKSWLRRRGYTCAVVRGDGEDNLMVFDPAAISVVEERRVATNRFEP